MFTHMLSFWSGYYGPYCRLGHYLINFRFTDWLSQLVTSCSEKHFRKSLLSLWLIPVNISAVQTYIDLSAFNGDSDIPLSCRVNRNDRVIWMHIRSPEAPQNVVFNGNNIEPQYSGRIAARVDQLLGYGNLTIINLEPNESGWYICMEERSNVVVETIRLTVLGELTNLSKLN